jgi:hypothetical protein
MPLKSSSRRSSHRYRTFFMSFLHRTSVYCQNTFRVYICRHSSTKRFHASFHAFNRSTLYDYITTSTSSTSELRAPDMCSSNWSLTDSFIPINGDRQRSFQGDILASCRRVLMKRSGLPHSIFHRPGCLWRLVEEELAKTTRQFSLYS